MKSKFNSMWRVAVALVMVLSLGLVMAVPVSAAVTQPAVTLDDAAPAATAEYTIEFTTNEDLEAGGGIVIEFPEGTGGLGSIGTSDVTVNPGSITVSNVANVDERLSLTLDAALDAGDITVLVGTSNTVTNPADGDYTLEVYTSQEPTRVTSETYMISGEASITAVVPDPDTVDTLASYGFNLITTVALAIGEDIFIEFPVDTDISALVKDDITITGETVDHIHIDGQVLTINLGSELAAATTVVAIAAYITNPTTVLNPDPLEVAGTVDPDTDWRLTVYTTKERVLGVSEVYNLSEGLDVSQIAWLTVDEYVPNDAPSTAFVIQTQDEYGNAALVGADTTFALTASSGDFYSDVACERAQEITTIDILDVDDVSESAEFFYKGATTGTVDITASESPAATPDWTDGTAQILVNPMLELWGGGAWIADYGTFADAIAAAVPFDTIKVAPSTYDGFSVSKPGITIESTDGAATTIIEGNINLTAGADSLVLGGSADHGFTLKKGIESLIALTGPPDVEISYNTLETTTTRLTGATQVDAIRMWSGAISGLTVTENTFTLDTIYDMGVRGHATASVSGLTVTNNIFTGVGSTLDHNAIEINELNIVTLDSTISGNEINGVMNGILIGDGGGDGLTCTSGTGTLEVNDNTFDGCANGIYLLGHNTGSEQNVVITENTFTSNTKGLAISDDAWTPEDFAVKYNDFVGNTYGVFNAASTAVTAQYNWWGDFTGPSADPEPADPDADPTAYGEGDAISALVTPYDPWLAVSQSVCVPATSSRYAIEIRLLNVASYSAGTWSGGWNTFSTPISLHGDGDTWEDITTLVDLQAAMVYGWDGTDWIAPFPSTTVITPLDAIFVQMKEEARLPILFSTQLLPAATKDLSAGWNLIGLAALTEDGYMYRDDALASLGAGDNAKYSQVIDPISGAVILTGTTDEGSKMYPGQGYWVFMTADATLAGFSVTPQPWAPVE